MGSTRSRGGPEEHREPLDEGLQVGHHGRERGARRSVVPASVEMATAPMLIQSGGPRSDELSAKNVWR